MASQIFQTVGFVGSLDVLHEVVHLVSTDLKFPPDWEDNSIRYDI